MSIRSEILIHWTEPKHEKDEFVAVEKYVALIKSIYSKGLLFSLPKNEDVVHGALGTLSKIPRIPVICYTELRLSDVGKHTDRYGKMGIGFGRDWLMHDRGANPVFYVQNSGQGVVSTNLANIISKLDKIDGLKMFLSFVKPMSEYHEPSLTYYDEMEWRMVEWTHLYRKEESQVQESDSSWFRKDGSIAYFAFSPDDVAIIVAPNEETRKAILLDSRMREYFDKYLPMMVTADSCSQF